MRDEAGRHRGLDPLGVGGRQDAELAHSDRHQAPLQGTQQRKADAPPALSRRDHPAQHPGALAVDPREDRSYELALGVERHERRMSRRERRDDLGEGEHGRALDISLLEQADCAVEVGVVEVVNHWGHLPRVPATVPVRPQTASQPW